MVQMLWAGEVGTTVLVAAWRCLLAYLAWRAVKKAKALMFAGSPMNVSKIQNSCGVWDCLSLKIPPTSFTGETKSWKLLRFLMLILILSAVIECRPPCALVFSMIFKYDCSKFAPDVPHMFGKRAGKKY